MLKKNYFVAGVCTYKEGQKDKTGYHNGVIKIWRWEQINNISVGNISKIFAASIHKDHPKWVLHEFVIISINRV